MGTGEGCCHLLLLHRKLRLGGIPLTDAPGEVSRIPRDLLSFNDWVGGHESPVQGGKFLGPVLRIDGQVSPH